MKIPRLIACRLLAFVPPPFAVSGKRSALAPPLWKLGDLWTIHAEYFLPNKNTPVKTRLDASVANEAVAAGSLSAASGATDYTGSFTTTLTSNHKASGPTKAYRATVSATANGQLTQKTHVRFDKTKVTVTSDVTKIPPGGTANLTATLTFEGQAVAGHNLKWSIAGIWDASGTQIYDGTGTAPSGYGHIKSATSPSDANGQGTAVFKAGDKKGKVQVECSDESVEIRANWRHPDEVVALQEKKDTVLIWADVNRDGKIDEGDRPKNLKLNVGTLVMADKEGVYSDKPYTALRREIKVTTDAAGAKVVVARSSDNLLLFDAKTGGTELFGKNDDVKLMPGTSYWLQGGAKPSNKVRDQWLKARPDRAGAAFEDQINATVLWTEIKPKIKGKFSEPPIYDGYKNMIGARGQALLGVRTGSSDLAVRVGTDQSVCGGIEVTGVIYPNDLSFNQKITDNLVVQTTKTEPDDLEKSVATADFGFVFKRKRSGNETHYQFGPIFPGFDTVSTGEGMQDDSRKLYQDVNPDKNGANELVIVDGDSPGDALIPTDYNRFITQYRVNFDENLVFNFYPKTPERCSRMLKWAISLDMAWGYNEKAVCIVQKPNDGEKANFLKVDGHVDIKNFKLPAPKLDKNSVADAQKKVKRNKDFEMTIKGENLAGLVYLEKENTYMAKRYFAKDTFKDPAENIYFSDLTEIKVVFEVPAKVGKGYSLVVENSGGKTSLAGFEVVD